MVNDTGHATLDLMIRLIVNLLAKSGERMRVGNGRP